MPLNRISLGFTIGDLPEFCGPGDLADCLISLRKSERKEVKGLWAASLSEEGIRRLINLAFHASMVSEEGRFPSFRIVSHGKDNIRTIAECDVVLDTVDKLRRLAPAVSGDHSVALLVSDDTGPLRCVGLSIVDAMGFGANLDDLRLRRLVLHRLSICASKVLVNCALAIQWFPLEQ